MGIPTRVMRRISPLSVPRDEACSAIVKDEDGQHEMWVMGGADDEHILATVEAYSPRTNTWRLCRPLSEGRRGAVAGVVGGRLVVAGGSAWRGLRGRLDISRGLHSDRVDPAPASATCGRQATACVLNGRLYVMGGHGCNKLQVLEMSEEHGFSWSVKADLPAYRREPEREERREIEGDEVVCTTLKTKTKKKATALLPLCLSMTRPATLGRRERHLLILWRTVVLQFTMGSGLKTNAGMYTGTGTWVGGRERRAVVRTRGLPLRTRRASPCYPAWTRRAGASRGLPALALGCSRRSRRRPPQRALDRPSARARRPLPRGHGGARRAAAALGVESHRRELLAKRGLSAPRAVGAPPPPGAAASAAAALPEAAKAARRAARERPRAAAAAAARAARARALGRGAAAIGRDGTAPSRARARARARDAHVAVRLAASRARPTCRSAETTAYGERARRARHRPQRRRELAAAERAR